MRLAVFYHVWCSNHWREVVEEQLKALRESGLTEVASVSIGVIGEPLAHREVWDMAKIKNVSIWLLGDDPTQYEFPTLDRLREHAAVNDGAVCYIHSKGVSVPRNNLHDWWRETMMNGVIRNWRECVAALEAGSDVAGCKFTHSVHGDLPYFAGNFWWAKCSHIRTLPPFARPHRYEAERWVCGNNPVEFHIPVSRPL